MTMFRATTRLFSESRAFPYTLETNPYRAKRYWPPDFETLSPNYRFRLERRFRRRNKLKWARPTFMAWTKLAMWILPIGVLGWTVLYLDMGDNKSRNEPGPFDGIRASYKSLANSLFSHTSHAPPPGKSSGEVDSHVQRPA